MKYRPLLAIVSSLVLTGCGGDPPVPDQMNQPKTGLNQSTPTNPQANQTTINPKTAQPPVQNNIPAGARYSIVCDRFSGQGHELQSKLVKERLIKQTARNDFYVVHEEQYSLLMYGYYTEIEHGINAREADRAAGDRKWLETLTTSNGDRMFRNCLAIPLPQLDPQGPPEWDLTKLDANKPLNDPTRKYWTIVIAAYTAQGKDDNDRPINYKQFAVDSVKDARAQGIEAYYFFGDGISQVCIGAWPRAAVKEQENAKAQTNGGDRGSSNSEIYVSNTPMSEAQRKQIEAKGNVKVFAPKVEIADPTLIKMMQQYPEYAVNKYVTIDKESGKPQPSFLAEIPKLQPSIVSGTTSSGSQSAPPPNLLNPQPSGSDTGGRLRRAQ